MKSNSNPNQFGGPICEGVYKTLSDVPCFGKGFSSKQWVNQSLSKTLKLLEVGKSELTIPANVVYRSSLLPFLASLFGEEREQVSILDFGGGLGITFIPVASGLAGKALEYHIVESEIICEKGARIFKNDARIHFHPSLPELIKEIDIVHLGSSLQYIEDWKGLLQRLAYYRPRYILLTDLTAGDIPPFASAQNYYGSKIPCWFFNINEIIQHMIDLGFNLLFKSTYRNTYLGEEQEFPLDNFPEELRLGNTAGVLFAHEKN